MICRRLVGLALLLAWQGLAHADDAKPAQRPNILWIFSDDHGPELGCYGVEFLRTPNLDKLASEGMRFNYCYTNGPVCSASRSALMTGMYQTSIGAHHHRSHRKDGFKLPPNVKMITDYFREAGYFTCNGKFEDSNLKQAGKTDFNFTAVKPFDGTNWNQRKPGQPFFAQINFIEPHRGANWKQNSQLAYRVDPAKVVVPPYYPDTPEVRQDFANYYDAIDRLDIRVGKVLKRLAADGLADNTIVFFFGDNGRCHLRDKQWLYDGGLHVPLIVRWPGHIKPASINNDLISGIDISVTSLKLAGITIPKHMHGQVFLGPEAAPARKYIIGARDRCDETVDRIRSVHTHQYNYIRNFMPEKPYTQTNEYKETNYPVLNIMKKLHKEGKLNATQQLFMVARKPDEELYDLKADPWEIHNLAKDPKHQQTLKEMRKILDGWIKDTNDHGAIPEKPEEPGKPMKKKKS